MLGGPDWGYDLVKYIDPVSRPGSPGEMLDHPDQPFRGSGDRAAMIGSRADASVKCS
jgi:hypothetical protein